MNTSNVDSRPKVRKETKNKIKVDFERTSFKERFKAKFLTLTFVKKVLWAIIRYILLIGIAYIVLFPFFSKISASVMSFKDFNDSMVRLVPKNFSIDIYKAIFVEQEYMRAFGNTFLLSFSTAGFGRSMIYNLMSTFLLIFYTDSMHLTFDHAGMIILITRIFDAFNDPVMGIIADKTKSTQPIGCVLSLQTSLYMAPASSLRTLSATWTTSTATVLVPIAISIRSPTLTS